MQSIFKFNNSNTVSLLVGDCLDILPTLPEKHFQTCVTSPPYFGLRDYQVDGQIGMEQTPDAYVTKLVDVFREVRRVLRDDGTVWLNLGDSYATNNPAGRRDLGNGTSGRFGNHEIAGSFGASTRANTGLKAKDLLGMPWRVAFALQADGWWLRSAIVWNKPNPMPESVRDRPTSAYEMVYLLAKSERYYYDADAISEPSVMRPQSRNTKRSEHPKGDEGRASHRRPEGGSSYSTRNARNVWTITPQSFKGAHFAMMAPELARRCILAGCPEGGSVLDPFGGAGTTGLVAGELLRRATLIELNPVYAEIADQRLGYLVDREDYISARDSVSARSHSPDKTIFLSSYKE